MSSTKIIQYIHRPNITELGMGNTHETYLLVDAKTDMSGVFPPNENVTVIDSENGKTYDLKSAKGSEFRINQMGAIYRDYKVMPGDEIIITHFETDGEIKNIISVHNYDRVGLSVGDNGTEIVNIERLAKYTVGDKAYSFVIKEGVDKNVEISFHESRKKRLDSPSDTDYYNVTIDKKPLSNGKYYVNLNGVNTIEPCPPKSEFNQVIIGDYNTPSIKVDSIKDRQIIYYGAPGTGKSYEINRLTKNKEVVRTTFHPDSDYSTFVGAYKPTSIEVPMRDVTGKVIIENNKQVTENRIVYEFVEQAFLQAYTRAWKAYDGIESGEKPKEQYLVIEEINRGNCAQIFGDLFQLLDRNYAGFSDYPISADKDLKKQLAKDFKDLSITDAERINGIYGKDIVSLVLNGDILLLPDNLFIWATMNTSDQSLFPIDSAFKRRWDWKYVPICEGRNEMGDELGYKIRVKGVLYDWWDFLDKMNKEIDEQTKSEDKKLGYFFCKADDGIISAETFVSKVVFYLWNDVFKDQEVGSIFRDGEDELTFSKFYDTDAKGKVFIVEDKVETLLKNLKVKEWQEEKDIEDGRMIVTLNGEEISEDTPSDTFVKTLQKIGLENLVDKTFDGSVIVTRTNQQPAMSRMVGEYYIYTGLWPKYKKRWLLAMAKEMKIDLIVE